ncbi:unnamed protein product [Alopecurus aequalis]
MVVMAESVQEQGLSAGMSELSKEHGEAVRSGRMQQARHAVTQFRGVRPKPRGRYGAQIWVPSRLAQVCLGTFDTAADAAKAYDAAAVGPHACTPGRAQRRAVMKTTAARPASWNEFRGMHRTLSGKYGAQTWYAKGRNWLGTFDAAEDAARAYDAAAVMLHGARAITNFSPDKDVTTETMTVKKEETAKPHSWTEFRGAHRTRGGKYGAQIGQPKRKARATWLGTFGSAEDAARAYDAAALKLYGAAAKTNFEQPPAGAAAEDGEESSMDLLNDFSGMPALEFLSHSSISGAQLDDLWASLPPADRQLVDGFIKEPDFSDVLS